MSKIMIKIPSKAIIKNKSAILSSFFSRDGLSTVRIERKEEIQEKVSKTPTIEVISSILCVSLVLLMWTEVITKRQKPRRVAEELKICCEVLFAILCFNFYNEYFSK